MGHRLDRKATSLPSAIAEPQGHASSHKPGTGARLCKICSSVSLPLNARSATPLGFLFQAAGVSKFSSP